MKILKITRLLACLPVAALMLGKATPLAAQGTRMPYKTANGTQYQYLSGPDKDHAVNWDFKVNTGFKSGTWSKIPVPSNWELQGFGTYNYYKDTKNPEEEGDYRYKFNVPASSSGKKVYIVFEAAMTETDVKINGKSAGPVHQGGFYRFKYDITNLLNYGKENLLEVNVKKRTSNESVNNAERKADFWLFGGIYRPVYLETVPQTHIDRIAINAKADGALNLDVYLAGATGGNIIQARVMNLNGQPAGKPFTVKAAREQVLVHAAQMVQSITNWNPESPKLYNLIVSISDGKGKTLHQVEQRFGFRTAELRPHDGFYVNNKKVIFKGVCHHSEWPESGRALSKENNLNDIKLIKDMNMNAVRMSHYPPDQDFLDACDSLGLFVLDELTGWQAKYDTIVGRKLVKELVVRDVNHPSIVIWDNGNEGGFNFGLDNDYAKYDPQNRLVIHPWEKFNGTDTKHYPDYNYIQNSVLYGKEVFFPTEFMHGLQDGGHGAGLDDFWSLMLKHPFGAGGFLWSFHDEGVARTDRNGEIDIQGNAAPDGIVGPHREKEGSYYTIKEIWSPVQIQMKTLPQNFDGRIPIENRYIYTNLNKCRFEWRLATLPQPGSNSILAKVNTTGKSAIALAPNEQGTLQLTLPVNWKGSDVLYLTAYGVDQKEIFTWSWPVKMPASNPVNNIAGNAAPPSISQTDSSLIVKAGNVSYYFSNSSGNLQKVVNGVTAISLSDGPVLAGGKYTFKKINHYTLGGDVIVEPVYDGGQQQFRVKWTIASGKPAKLDYTYAMRGELDFMGITFNYPEDKVTGMKWEGRGPYHVWKNRLKGQQFGVWQKQYNNTVTGESWQYPEFKGYHADLYWVTVENKEAPFTVYATQPNTFLQMYKPLKAKGATNEFTNPVFPAGNIGFMDAISPIGTKFQSAEKMGPQSQKNMQLNYTPVSGSLWFDFSGK